MTQSFPKTYYLLSLFAGALSALAMAPYNIWVILLVGLGFLYIAVDRAHNKRQAFFTGWLFGFGYFVIGFYWIGNALLVEGNPYKWAWPLAVCGLPAVMAFYVAIPALIAGRYLDLKQWHGYIGFVFLVAGFEWLRGHLFTGFPWNLFGYTWIGVLPIAQLASLSSIYLLSFLTIFWLSIGGFIFVSGARIAQLCIGFLIVVTAMGGGVWGSLRLSQAQHFHDMRIKVVQPNTPQEEKWQRDKMAGHFETALELSRYQDGEAAAPIIIVWPETTISPAFLDDPVWRGEIIKMLNTYADEAILMAGALRYQPENASYHNSILTINKVGVTSNIYDKSHLVPFGEYIPFQKWIPLDPVVQFKGFERGQGLQTYTTIGDLRYSPLVCYEVIFPKKSVVSGSDTDFIVNVTNDAWYGVSPGPYQHYVQAQFRAIEEGVPLVRAANTGFSGVIDAYGRTVVKSGLYDTDSLVTALPKAIR